MTEQSFLTPLSVWGISWLGNLIIKLKGAFKSSSCAKVKQLLGFYSSHCDSLHSHCTLANNTHGHYYYCLSFSLAIKLYHYHYRIRRQSYLTCWRSMEKQDKSRFSWCQKLRSVSSSTFWKSDWSCCFRQDQATQFHAEHPQFLLHNLAPCLLCGELLIGWVPAPARGESCSTASESSQGLRAAGTAALTWTAYDDYVFPHQESSEFHLRPTRLA